MSDEADVKVKVEEENVSVKMETDTEKNNDGGAESKEVENKGGGENKDGGEDKDGDDEELESDGGSDDGSGDEDGEQEPNQKGGRPDKDESYKRQLFLQFPVRKMPDNKGLLALHSDIIDVEIPSIRNPRFCWVEFATREKAEKALQDLSTMRFDGGKYIRVSWKANPNLPKRFRREVDSKKKWILIQGLPKNVTAEELKDAYIGVHRCTIGSRTSKKNCPPGSAILVFNCVKNAVDMCEDKSKHVFKGSPVVVDYLKKGPSKKALAKKRRMERRREYDQQYFRGGGGFGRGRHGHGQGYGYDHGYRF